MATTSNYGWTTPDDSSLVKDGASAIRTLGSAIDTSLNTALGTKKAGMVLLNTTSFSAVASQSINDVFSATYDNYRIVLDFSNANAGSALLTARLRVSGADNSTANYQTQYINAGSTTVSGARSTGATSWTLAATTNTNIRSQVIADISNPFLTQVTAAISTANDSYNSASQQFSLYSYSFNATTSFTGFSIIASTSNITGTVSVYGYNK